MKQPVISYLPHKLIDKTKWDRCIEQDRQAAVFFYSWFLDVVCPKWDALVAGDYEAVFPLPYKSRLGIQYIIQPFFTRTLDICSSDKKRKNISLYLDAIPAKFRLQEFCLDSPLTGNATSYRITEKQYQVIHTVSDFEIVRKNYSANTRQNLKKAEKNALVFTQDVSTTKIRDDFKKHKGKELAKFGAAEYKHLGQLMDACIKHGKGYTCAVNNREGKRLASAFFMHTHDHIIYLKGSVSEEGKKSGAMHFLMSSMIQICCSKAGIFDFGGSSIPSLARFFKGFGATDRIYYAVRKNNLPAVLRWIK